MGDLEERLAALSPRQRQLLARRLIGGAPSAGTPAGGAPGRQEPVAIVGMACRFPGAANTPAAYWDLLRRGGDAIVDVPPDRWDPAKTLAPEVSCRGGFLESIDGFDAAFFGISPREATLIDPQHRLLLEVAWEALEDAGLAAERLGGSSTGVFAALYQRDFLRQAYADPARLDAYAASGTHHSIAANRLSYTFDLRGPSLVVDTACSSSLVAVHLACQSLARRECDTAMVGAVNLMLLPEETLALSRWGMLAPDGRCKTFDARADGFVRGEGCGVLVLKRRADAERDGDLVHAALLGTAVNQDGRSNGLTAPNGEAQEAVIRQALETSGCARESIRYVEAHGTGTRLGDPIEVEALVETLGPEGPTCRLGSAKANLGHLEAAAGMAGLLKTVLCLRHRQVPPQLHLQELNPLLPLGEGRFRVPTRLEPLDTLDTEGADTPLRAGVSSFGMGGTNAHLIVEAGPRPKLPEASPEVPWLVPLAARSQDALVATARRLRTWLDAPAEASANPSSTVAEIAATRGQRRSHDPHRVAWVAQDRPRLVEALDRWLEAPETTPPPTSTPGVVFIFPGQGWQWPGMARSLEAEPVFSDTLRACAEAVGDHGGFDLLDVWRRGGDDGRWQQIELLQPVLFALQVALAAQWRAWGVEPDAVIGHSLGEVAAARVAGALDLDDAARVICRRSRLLRTVRGGAMAAVDLDRAAAEAALADHHNHLAIAAENGPRSTVLSGRPEALEAVLARLEAEGVFCRRIQVDVASHSPWVDPLRDALLEELAPLRPRAGQVPIYSTVEGRRVDGSGFDAAYWSANLRQTVRFRGAIEQAQADGLSLVVELSGHPILLPALREADDAALTLVASGRRGHNARTALLEGMGSVYAAGASVDWRALAPPAQRRVDLPTYPWQRKTFPRPRGGGAPRRVGSGPVELLGAEPLPLAGLDEVLVFEGVVDPARHPSLDDHRVHGKAILPGVATVTTVLAALRHPAVQRWWTADHQDGEGFRLASIRYHRPLVLDPPPRVQWTLRRQGAGGHFEVAFAETRDDAWTLHAMGRFVVGAPSGGDDSEVADRTAVESRCLERFAPDTFYRQAGERGNAWGPAFRGISSLHLGEGEVVTRLRVPESLAPEVGGHRLHPALLDAAGQALILAAPIDQCPDGPFVLGEIETARVLRSPGPEPWSHLQLRLEDEPGRLRGDLRLYDAEGRLCAEVAGLAIDFLETRESARLDHHLYALEWREKPKPDAPGQVEGVWRVLAEDSPQTEALVARLRAQGADIERLPRAAWGDPEQAGVAPGTAYLVDLRGMELSNQGDELRGAAAAAKTGSALLDTARAWQPWLAPGGLWWVTRGARQVEGSAAIPGAATVWGLARVLAAEHTELLGRCVDLDPGGPSAPELDFEDLATEIGLGDLETEREVAWRAGRRWVPRLASVAPSHAGVAARPAQLAADATYLITGGLGGLGLAVARGLVEHGARRLLLLSRRPLPARSTWRDLNPESAWGKLVEALRELEHLGAGVHTVSVDVADSEGLAEALASFDAEGWPAIRGVVHAAGVQDPQPSFEVDALGLEAELAAKLDGGLALHRHLEGTALDFCVHFASGANHLGSPFLAGYTAANQALAALAEDARRRGWPTLALEWGYWSDVGMAERLRHERGRSPLPQGMRSFTPEQGVDLLLRLLGAVRGTPPTLAVLPLDWSAWATAYPTAAQDPRFVEVLGRARDTAGLGIASLFETPVLGTSASGAKVPDFALELGLRQRLDAIAATTADDPGTDDAGTDASDADEIGVLETERRAVLEDALRRRVARVLRCDATTVDLEVPLTRLGLDSLMAIEIRNWVQAELDIRVPILRLLGDGGLRSVIDLLVDELAAEEEMEEFEI